MTTTKAVEYRNKVIEELWLTETTYVDGLNDLIRVFIQPLETNSLLSNDDHHILFPIDIKIIHNLHQNLLLEFHREFENSSTHDNHPCNVGKIFIEHAQH
eukprot:265822_1